MNIPLLFPSFFSSFLYKSKRTPPIFVWPTYPSFPFVKRWKTEANWLMPRQQAHSFILYFPAEDYLIYDPPCCLPHHDRSLSLSPPYNNSLSLCPSRALLSLYHAATLSLCPSRARLSLSPPRSSSLSVS